MNPPSLVPSANKAIKIEKEEREKQKQQEQRKLLESDTKYEAFKKAEKSREFADFLCVIS